MVEKSTLSGHSVDPDQTLQTECGIWSGSILCARACLSQYLGLLWYFWWRVIMVFLVVHHLRCLLLYVWLQNQINDWYLMSIKTTPRNRKLVSERTFIMQFTAQEPKISNTIKYQWQMTKSMTRRRVIVLFHHEKHQWHILWWWWLVMMFYAFRV